MQNPLHYENIDQVLVGRLELKSLGNGYYLLMMLIIAISFFDDFVE